MNKPSPKMMDQVLAVSTAGAMGRYTFRDTSPGGKADPVASRSAHRAARNDPCPCGSGKKFKKCCRGKS